MGSGKDTVLLQLEKFFGKKDSIETYIRLGIFILLLVCVFSRICLYLFPKDMWLDECLLYNGISSHGWKELFCGNLSAYMEKYTDTSWAQNYLPQSAPLLFVIISRIIISFIGNNQLCLTFLPFACSVLAVLLLFLICRKAGDIFYQFSTLAILSFCLTATYYTIEFKQYAGELFISLLLIFDALKKLDGPGFVHRDFPSLKTTIFYCLCILGSSPAILFIPGVILAEFLIARLGPVGKRPRINYGKILFLLLFVAVYYYFYLRAGNTPGMKEYWKSYFIPLRGWDAFWEYWVVTGSDIFYALFPGPNFSVLLFLGLLGGSALLWRHRPDFLLLLALPAVVTFLANFFFYPPGHGKAPHGGRLLLFLLPNAVLVAGWFYGWLLRKLAAVASYPPPPKWRKLQTFQRRTARIVFLGLLCAVLAGSLWDNGAYLYSRAYHIQQIGELVRIFRQNLRPESLNLVYGMSQPAYQYYQQVLGGAQPEVEYLPIHFEPLKARLEQLPEHRRVLLLFSQLRWKLLPKLPELEELFRARGREFVKIPAKDALLYILPAKQ